MASEEVWVKAQKILGFTDDEMEIIRNDPKRSKAIERGPQLVRTKVIAEVFQAKNCPVHGEGSKYVIRGTGAILPRDAENNMCLDCMPLFIPFQHMVYDKVLEGEEVTGMQTFVRCPDTGVDCGGMGTVTLKLTVEQSK